MRTMFKRPTWGLMVSSKNWHEKATDRLSTGDRVSDSVARVMGSWRFILILTAFITAWITLNLVAWVGHWDPYPFILLNLAFSAQATYATPIILMSQNRAAERDKVQAEHQYEHNDKALAENTDLTKAVHDLTVRIDAVLNKES
jgi:uncharacterized membrane protein